MKTTFFFTLAALTTTVFSQTEFSAFGADSSAIQSTVDGFRAALGPNNGVGPGIINPDGRREINWDAVPDSFSSPNDLPANFFNNNSKRGAIFSGAQRFRVSADNDNPTNTPPLFAELNPDYANTFSVFSQQRLFSSVDSNVYDVEFFVSGSNTRGLTRAFGAVFTDVDLNNLSSIEFFDQSDRSIHTMFVKGQGDFTTNRSLSFAGAMFAAPVISRVRITLGNSALGSLDGDGHDVVVNDDFIYGEVVPEPASMVALAGGLLVNLRRRKSK